MSKMFDDIPDELVLMISRKCRVIDLINLAYTCKRLFEILREQIMKTNWSLRLEYHQMGEDLMIHEIWLRLGERNIPERKPCFLCNHANYDKDFHSHQSVDFTKEDVKIVKYRSTSKRDFAQILSKIRGDMVRDMSFRLDDGIMMPFFGRRKRKRFRYFFSTFIAYDVSIRSGTV